MTDGKRRCKNLVLDAGPLLSLSPLRGLAETYLIVPQVLDELKDKRAREHFEQLGLSTGVRVNVRSPDPASLFEVIQFAKKTGDYAVLSHADICVLALTHTLHVQERALQENQEEEARTNDRSTGSASETHDSTTTNDGNMQLSASMQRLTVASEDGQAGKIDTPLSEEGDPNTRETSPANVLFDSSDRSEVPSHPEKLDEPEIDRPLPNSTPGNPPNNVQKPLYDDPSSEEDDGEGDWITPGNVALYKSRALELLPSSDGDRRKRASSDAPVVSGCMTADFAMQNVLLQMGLTLVSTDGRRIQKVKNWVLRCHACFKICKDSSKQFCPSCGNPTLMRVSVTVASPDASADAPAMELHLKTNFQYRVRGTKYSIPAPKPGSAKAGPGEGLILREDQSTYMRAKKRVEVKRARDEQRMIKGLIERGGEGGVAVGNWSDPDWVPGILGGSNKARSTPGDMPQIGFGRKNPNEKKRRK
ncbi:Nin one binding Zn-ribbon like-domain-containing protein [Phlebopus sp. FC_14]|nr:Nin one binding Zn-ribbon like-domain-containing protein [Phlebopus sp. FC_14]